jgi:hypothetical protein
MVSFNPYNLPVSKFYNSHFTDKENKAKVGEVKSSLDFSEAFV